MPVHVNLLKIVNVSPSPPTESLELEKIIQKVEIGIEIAESLEIYYQLTLIHSAIIVPVGNLSNL